MTINMRGQRISAIAEEAQARSELAIAEEGLTKTQVSAPFDGVLSSRRISVGAYVKDYDPLVRLQTLSPIRFEFQLPVQKISLIQKGQPVQTNTDAYPGRNFKGKIVVIEPRADEKTHNVKVLAEFPNAKGKLLPGMYGQISIPTTDKHEGLIIPEEALVVRQKGLYVYKVLPEENTCQPQKASNPELKAKPEPAHMTKYKSKLVKITVGTRFNDQVEILSGLSKGDEIVLKGQDKINDNADIEVYKPQS